MEKRFALIALVSATFAMLSLGGCQTVSDAPVSSASVRTNPTNLQPPAFVEAACGGCHGVEPPHLSPNPNAPSFAAIANRQGLSEATLSDWLHNAHNYPEVMDFDLQARHVDQVADYMITLRRADYVPEQ